MSAHDDADADADTGTGTGTGNATGMTPRPLPLVAVKLNPVGRAQTFLRGDLPDHDAPRTGRLAPCDEPGALADAVVDLLDQPGLREEMGRAGRPWVVEWFDWEVLEQQARELFHRTRNADLTQQLQGRNS